MPARLVIGGATCDQLARDFGTPLYIYDEATLRAACRGYTRALADTYPNALVLYAGKAYVDPTLLQVAASEGLGMDAVSSGEVRVAQAAGLPLEHVVLHGNNKLPREIDLALELGVGPNRRRRSRRDRDHRRTGSPARPHGAGALANHAGGGSAHARIHPHRRRG